MVASSPASEDSTSASSGPDSAPSGKSKSTPTPSGSSKKTSPEPADTRTFDPSTELWPTPSVFGNNNRKGITPKAGDGLATAARHASRPRPSSPAGSPANLFPSPASDAALKTIVTSGRTCAALLTKSGPVGSWLRTCLASSRWRSTRCYLTWKPSATPAGRLLFRLVPSMPRTGGTDSGLWATPSSSRTGDFTVDGRTKQRRPSLQGQAKMWPTPAAQMGKGPGHGPNKEGAPNLQTVIGGSLNPTWVEWLMGFPIGWTDLGPSATPSSLRSRKRSRG